MKNIRIANKHLTFSFVVGRKLILMGLLTFTLLIPNWAGAELDFNKFVVFGTSLSDPGNIFEENHEVNVPPEYNLDSFLIPNAPYAIGGHHLSNGPTWVEQLARPLGLSRSVQPASRGKNPNAMNYATDGTRAGFQFPGKPLFADQVGDFLVDVGGVAPSDAVYFVEIGSNDVRDALGAFLFVLQTTGNPIAAQVAAEGILTAALTQIGINIHALHSAGAHQFLYFNSPPIGVTPAVMALDQALTLPLGPNFVINLVNSLADNFNFGLDGTFATLPGADITQLDVFSITNQIIANQADYGLTNVVSACIEPLVPPFKCLNPDEYLFWDGIHPTKATHGIFAEEAATVLGID